MSGQHACRTDETPLRLLIVLFGVLEFDGRAQRMIEVLAQMGRVTLVDLAPADDVSRLVIPGIDRIAVRASTDGGRMRRHLTVLAAVLRHAIRVKPQIVVAENFLTTGTARLAAALTGARLVYDAYELIIPESTGRMSGRDRFWYVLERWAVKHAAVVVAANEDRARLMAGHYNLKRVPLVMRNIPPDRGTEFSMQAIVDEYPALARRSREDRIILYQGDVSLSRGLARFLDAMRCLPSNYRLVVVGDGPDLQCVVELARHLAGEGRFSAVGRVPNRVMSSITRTADVGLVTYPFEGLNNIYCASNKVFEYAQAGVPVVATDQPSLLGIVEHYGIGVCVGQHETPEQVARAIQSVVTRGREAYASALARLLAENTWADEAVRFGTEMNGLLAASSRIDPT